MLEVKSKVSGHKGGTELQVYSQSTGAFISLKEFVTERGRSGLSYPSPKARPASVLKELEAHGPQDLQIRFGSKTPSFMALSRPWMNPGQMTTALIRGPHREGQALSHTSICKRVGL